MFKNFNYEKYFYVIGFVFFVIALLEFVIGMNDKNSHFIAKSSGTIFVGLWCFENVEKYKWMNKYNELKNKVD